MVSYTSNADGLRQSRQDSSGTKSWLWDTAAKVPLLLTDGSRTYLYGPNLLPVAQIDSGGTITYLHGDNIGSLRLSTDSAGHVSNVADYDPYGNAISSGTGSSFGYAGAWTDSVTGLVYLRAREYDAKTGQFLQVDPAVASTQDPYAYVANDPLAVTDPSGLKPCAPETQDYVFKSVCQQAKDNAAAQAAAAKASQFSCTDLLLASEQWNVYQYWKSQNAEWFYYLAITQSIVSQDLGPLALGALGSYGGEPDGEGEPSKESESAAEGAALYGSPNDVVQLVARSVASDRAALIKQLTPGEGSAYLDDTENGSRFLGQAVHQLTANTLDALFPGRFTYHTVGPDFQIVDSATGEVTYVELTTPGQVGAHVAKGGDYNSPWTSYATYSLP